MIGLMRFDIRAKCGVRNLEYSSSPFPSPHWGEGGVRGTPNYELRTARLSSPKSHYSELFVSTSGMTLVEVITVLAILAILAAVVIPKLGLPTTTSTASVDGAAYMVASDIRYVQEFAMANRVSKTVTFTSGSSTYTFGPANTLDPSGRLPSGITARDNYTITFNSLGEPIAGGGGSVRVWDGVRTRTITVLNYTGKVNIS